MAKRSFAVLGMMVLILALGVLSPAASASSRLIATPTPTPEPRTRITEFDVEVNYYEWWMLRWSDSHYVCSIYLEHEGLPAGQEIYTACGPRLYEDWIDTLPCPQVEQGGDTTECKGVYLYFASETTGTKKVKVELPLPTVWVSLHGCEYQSPSYTCTSQPYLVLEGQEPLPNETIIAINGTLDGAPFTCPGSACALPLPPTGEQGIQLEFWAESSYGDSSETFTALARAIPQGDFSDPEAKGSDTPKWTADVLSSQWTGERPASCSDIWKVFPQAQGLPEWLQTPLESTDLESSVSYYYLAARLINQGAVDVSECADGGLANSQVASECGVAASQALLDEWQNTFNQDILAATQTSGVPAQLLKNLFSKESQFWPGIYHTYLEAGLGQMSEYGADTLLLWNPSFYNQFCPLVFTQETCSQGFLKLTEDQQDILRGALVQNVDASCATCPLGIDLSQANFSVDVFASSLVANCQQVNQMLENITKKETRKVAAYEDLWRFTLANYNAGSGCLANALDDAYSGGDPLDWTHVGYYLDDFCPGSVDYVDDITNFPPPEPEPTPWVQPTGNIP